MKDISMIKNWQKSSKNWEYWLSFLCLSCIGYRKNLKSKIYSCLFSLALKTRLKFIVNICKKIHIPHRIEKNSSCLRTSPLNKFVASSFSCKHLPSTQRRGFNAWKWKDPLTIVRTEIELLKELRLKIQFRWWRRSDKNFRVSQWKINRIFLGAERQRKA